VVDEKKFPQMTPELRQAMMDEVRAFIESLMRDGGSLLDFIDCDYAWMNGLTAKLYGNDEVKGAKMQKVHLETATAAALIGMPGDADGHLALQPHQPGQARQMGARELLDASPPPPPPNVPGRSTSRTCPRMPS
jgi:hypothetical protein